MSEQPSVYAAEWPPGVQDFEFRNLIPALRDTVWDLFFTKVTVLVWLAVAVIIVFFLFTYRRPALVPSKGQWFAELIYGFVRDNIAKDGIGGRDGPRFAPYLTVLFCFILLTNMFSIVPLVQISPNSHIAFPIVLAVLSWLIYNYVGVRKHGFLGYLKATTIPSGVPWLILPILVPIEFFSNLILRPITLAVRLFASMFAGHLILLVFAMGGAVLLASENFFLKVAAFGSFAMGIAMTFFELLIIVLQAYIFTLLTSLYIGGALAEEH